MNCAVQDAFAAPSAALVEGRLRSFRRAMVGKVRARGPVVVDRGAPAGELRAVREALVDGRDVGDRVLDRVVDRLLGELSQ